MVQSDNTFYVQTDAEGKSFIHLIIIPLIISAVIYAVEPQFSLFGGLGWIVMVTILQSLRVHQNPTAENRLRFNVYMNNLIWLIIILCVIGLGFFALAA